MCGIFHKCSVFHYRDYSEVAVFKAVAVPCKMLILSWCIGADGSGTVVEESEKQKTGGGGERAEMDVGWKQL
jgi:hypothetical protein